MAGTNLPEILEMHHIEAIYNLAATSLKLNPFPFPSFSNTKLYSI